MILEVANDLCFYGPEQYFQPEDLATYHMDFLLGNIVDRKNAGFQDFAKARETFSHLVEQFKGRYIMGDRELWSRPERGGIDTPEKLFIRTNNKNVMLCNGHIPIMGEGSLLSKPGRSRFTRATIKLKHRFGIGRVETIPERYIESVHRYALHNCAHVVVLGQACPKQTQIVTRNNVKMIFLKPGINRVEV